MCLVVVGDHDKVIQIPNVLQMFYTHAISHILLVDLYLKKLESSSKNT